MNGTRSYRGNNCARRSYFKHGDLVVIGFWGKRYNYHHLFAETVSQSRNKWLNEMREYISEMLANKRRMVYGNVDEMSAVEICNKYDTCKFQVLMRLNINESDHRQLRALIIELDGYGVQKLGQKAVKQYEATELSNHRNFKKNTKRRVGQSQTRIKRRMRNTMSIASCIIDLNNVLG